MTAPGSAPDTAARPATTRLVLVRHGEVAERWRGTVYGRLDVELSERGHEQSERLGEVLGALPIDAVVSSGLRRAEAAAARVRAASGLERVDDPRFIEMDRGDWAGRRLEEIEAEDPGGYQAWLDSRGAMRAPGGESPPGVAARTVPAFEEWAARWPGGLVVIVAHLWVVRSGIAACLGLPMERSGELLLPPGGIAELDWPVARTAAPVLRRMGSDGVPDSLE